MTDEEIIAALAEADIGWDDPDDATAPKIPFYNDGDCDEILAACRVVIAAEREACAKVCDNEARHWKKMRCETNPQAPETVLCGYLGRDESAGECANKIRERSNAPHEGADAASSRTLPLDAVVGGAVSPAPTFGKDEK